MNNKSRVDARTQCSTDSTSTQNSVEKASIQVQTYKILQKSKETQASFDDIVVNENKTSLIGTPRECLIETLDLNFCEINTSVVEKKLDKLVEENNMVSIEIKPDVTLRQKVVLKKFKLKNSLKKAKS